MTSGRTASAHVVCQFRRPNQNNPCPPAHPLYYDEEEDVKETVGPSHISGVDALIKRLSYLPMHRDRQLSY
jgi:hypothetical protein